MVKQESRVLVIEVWSDKDYYESRFRMDGVEDEAQWVKACTKAVMLDLKRMQVKPDRMRTYYDKV